MEGKITFYFRQDDIIYLTSSFKEEKEIKKFLDKSLIKPEKFSLGFSFSLEEKTDFNILKKYLLGDFKEYIASIFFKKDFQKITEKELKNFLEVYSKSCEEDSMEVFLERWGILDFDYEVNWEREEESLF